MKVARVTNDGTLMLKGEVIEYPSELEGGRNLWLKLSDIDLTDYVIGHNVEYPVNDRFSLIGYGSGATSRINLGNELNVVFSESSNVNAYVRGNIINLLPNTIYTLSYTLSHEGDMEGKTLLRLFNRLRYTSNDNGLRFSDVITTNSDGIFDFNLWYDNAGLTSMNITFTISDIKLEIGDKATTWTPAPEDLDLVYPDDIQHFSTGFRADGTMMVRELIEVDNKFKVNQILENGDFRNGLDSWNFNSVQNDSIILENDILKFTTDGTMPSTISGNLVLNHQLEITHKYYAFANVKYIGTMRLKATTYLMEERVNNGEWVKLSGLIPSGGTFNRPFGIVILDKVPTDVEVKDLFFINLTETFGEGNEPSKDDCDKMFSNYYQNWGYAELISDIVISLKEGRLMVTELIENAIL